jgi:hypothetical protein
MAAQSLFLLVTPLGITFTYLVQDSTKPTGILALLPDRVRVGLIRQRRWGVYCLFFVIQASLNSGAHRTPADELPSLWRVSAPFVDLGGLRVRLPRERD